MRDVFQDVYNYAGLNATFPHETTADQFFSESQFESYRTLGRYEADLLSTTLKGTTAPTLQDFLSSVREQLTLLEQP